MEKEHQKQVQRRKAAKEKQNKPDSKKSNKKRHWPIVPLYLFYIKTISLSARNPVSNQ